MHNVVIVLGNSASSASPFMIGHAVMRDAIDATAVIGALQSVGLWARGGADPNVSGQLGNNFPKAEASPDCSLRRGRATLVDRPDTLAPPHPPAPVAATV